MRRVAPIAIKFIYSKEEDSDERLSIAYNRIFTLAKQRLLEKKKLAGKEVMEIETSKGDPETYLHF